MLLDTLEHYQSVLAFAGQLHQSVTLDWHCWNKCCLATNEATWSISARNALVSLCCWKYCSSMLKAGWWAVMLPQSHAHFLLHHSLSMVWDKDTRSFSLLSPAAERQSWMNPACQNGITTVVSLTRLQTVDRKWTALNRFTWYSIPFSKNRCIPWRRKHQ